MKFKKTIAMLLLLVIAVTKGEAQNESPIEGYELGRGAVFDDRSLINGYTEKYADENKDVLLAMIEDDTLGAYKCAAAIRVFKQKFGEEILKAEKPSIIRTLYHRLNRTDSPFVQVEIFHCLIVLDRYQYFNAMVPQLITKMDHYNKVVAALAYDNLNDLILKSTRQREARLIFTVLRKTLFLQKKRLENIQIPDTRLKNKLKLLRWTIKVLGTQELKNLPKEVIALL